jgi:DNA excision repair protein ERCC-4
MPRAPQPTIVIDTREQAPWAFTLPTVVGTVPTGADYTVLGFEASIGIERKSLSDLLGCITHDRERFMRSLAALRTRQWRALIVESSMREILRGDYMSRCHPNGVIGSLAAFMADGVPCFLAGDHGAAATFAERLLLKFHSRAVAGVREAA